MTKSITELAQDAVALVEKTNTQLSNARDLVARATKLASETQANLQAVVELHAPEGDGQGDLICLSCSALAGKPITMPCPTLKTLADSMSAQ